VRVIVVGSRSIYDPGVVVAAVEASGFSPSVVMTGGLNGVDDFAERWAAAHDIPVERFVADLTRYGTAAGPLRNREMLGTADALIAIWDGASPGTAALIEEARRMRKPVHVHRV
jgi:hypothetical protein